MLDFRKLIQQIEQVGAEGLPTALSKKETLEAGVSGIFEVQLPIKKCSWKNSNPIEPGRGGQQQFHSSRSTKIFPSEKTPPISRSPS